MMGDRDVFGDVFEESIWHPPVKVRPGAWLACLVPAYSRRQAAIPSELGMGA